MRNFGIFMMAMLLGWVNGHAQNVITNILPPEIVMKIGFGTVTYVSYALDISPDGSTVAVGYSDGIMFLNLKTHEEAGRIYTPARVTALAYSPDGRYFAAAVRKTYKIYVFDANSWNLLDSLSGHSSWINQLIFSNDGSLLISASDDNDVIVWEVSTGKELKRLEDHNYDVNVVALSKNGMYLASGDDDGKLIIWDITDWSKVYEQKLFLGDNNEIQALDFSPDGKWLIVGGNDGFLKVLRVGAWNIKKGFTDFSHTVKFAKFTTDGKYLVVCSGDSTITLYAPDNNWRIVNKSVKLFMANYVTISPDNSILVTVHMNGQVVFWDFSSLQPRYIVKRGKDSGGSLAISPDEHTLAVSQGNRIFIRKIDWKNRRIVSQTTLYGHSGNIMSMAFSPDGNYLVSGSADNRIILWNTVDWSLEKAVLSNEDSVKYEWRIPVYNNDGTVEYWKVTMLSYGVYDVGFVDSSDLISSNINYIKIWRTPSLGLIKSKRPIRGSSTELYDIEVRPDLGVVFVGTGDSLAILLKYPSLSKVKSYKLESGASVKCVAISPDGELLVYGGDDRIYIVKNWRKTSLFSREVISYIPIDGTANSMVLSPDGKLLVVGVGSYIYFIDTESQTISKRLLAHNDNVVDLRFVGNGKYLISVDDSGVMAVWNVKGGDNHE